MSIGRISDRECGALAVFDGMGGEACGETASYLAASAFDVFFHSREMKKRKSAAKYWIDACEEMNRKVCAYARENKIQSMGTTLAGICFTGSKAFICNLGDSRVYRIFRDKLTQISVDHVMPCYMFGKAPLTQYLGMDDESYRLEPSITEIAICDRERYLICSDGVTDMLKDGEIRRILLEGSSPEKCVEEMLEQALECGGRDNITAIVCEIRKQKSIESWIEYWKQKRSK